MNFKKRWVLKKEGCVKIKEWKKIFIKIEGNIYIYISVYICMRVYEYNYK